MLLFRCRALTPSLGNLAQTYCSLTTFYRIIYSNN